MVLFHTDDRSEPPARVFGKMVVPPPSGFAGVTIPVTMKVGQWFFVPICFNTWANTPGDFGYDHPWDTPYMGIPLMKPGFASMMKEFMDTLHPTCTIDGKPVQNIDLYRMQTGLFDLMLPADNAWGVPAGTYSPTSRTAGSQSFIR